MVKTVKIQEKWKKQFHLLSKKHYSDQLNAKRVSAVIQWLVLKHIQMNINFAKDSRKCVKKMEMVKKLREWIECYLNGEKGKLSNAKKAKLLKMKTRLPSDNLCNRIKFMELSDLLRYEMPKNMHDKPIGSRTMRIINQMEDDTSKLKSIDHKMLSLISEVHDLYAYIKFVKKAKISNKKLLMLMRRIDWNAEKTDRNIPIELCSTKQLENLPTILPDMYNYLE